MLEHYVRVYYQRVFVDPFIMLLSKSSKISANSITIAAAISGVMAGLSLALHLSIIGLMLLVISGWLDTLDGSFARATNTNSSRGSVLDIVFDRLVEFFIVFGLYLYQPAVRATAAICLLGSFLLCISSFLVVGIFSQNESQRSFHYSPGLIERAEVFMFFTLMIIFPRMFNVLAWLLLLLVLYTTFIRVLQFYTRRKS